MKAIFGSKISRVVAATALAVAIGAGAIAQPAAAGQTYSDGRSGYVVLPTATCYYKENFNQNHVRIPAPQIYAADVNWGGGNDGNWTRYVVYVLDPYGQVVRASNYSGWAYAYDNRPASFTGADLIFYGVPNGSIVAIGVEWYSPYGSAVYTLDRYTSDQGWTQLLNQSSCIGKYTWNMNHNPYGTWR